MHRQPTSYQAATWRANRGKRAGRQRAERLVPGHLTRTKTPQVPGVPGEFLLYTETGARCAPDLNDGLRS